MGLSFVQGCLTSLYGIRHTFNGGNTTLVMSCYNHDLNSYFYGIRHVFRTIICNLPRAFV